MRKAIILLGGIFLIGCTPTVKQVVLYKDRKDIVIVKKGQFLFTKEEKRFIRNEAKRFGISIPERKEIEHYIRKFLKSRKSLETALRRANLYIPYIKPILKEYGLPEELALLPIIESGFNPFAVSKSGAGGIWQLMPFTAKKYGLRIDEKIDERFDLIRSTHAAARYLKDLYTRFNDWELVLAAYNCGEGCVERKTGGADFWKTRWALPQQTRKYVPMFFAMLLIANSPEKYGLNVRIDSLKIEHRIVRRDESVEKFLREAKVKESTFRDMNPHIKGEYIPIGTYVYIPKREEKRVSAEENSTQVIVLENGAVLYIKE